MYVHGEGHYRDASRSRLLRLMIPSLAVGVTLSSGFANAQLTMLVPPQSTESTSVAPVLKSVGIKFRSADMTKSEAPASVPLPAKTTSAENTSTHKSIKPDILLPPLVAGSSETPTNLDLPKKDAVKFSVPSDGSTQMKSLPSMLVTAKDNNVLPLAMDKSVAPSELPALLQGIPTPPQTLQPQASPPATTIVEKKTQLTSESQRSPQVVKLPSMKVSSSMIVEAPKISSDEIAPTTKPAPSLVINKPSASPKPQPSNQIALQPKREEPLASKENSVRTHLNDEALAPSTIETPLKLQSQSESPDEKLTSSTVEVPEKLGTDLKNLPSVVALPVSRAQSITPSVETISKPVTPSPVASRKAAPTTATMPVAPTNPTTPAASTTAMTAIAPMAPPVATSKRNQPKTVEVLYRNVETIDVGRPVSRIDIQDESVCKALATEGTNVILIGLAKGQTTIKIWPVTMDGEEATPESYKVSVNEAWKSETQDNRNLSSVEDVQETLLEMFPSSEIKLQSASNGSLIIFGKAESNEQARQIAQLVRKTFLVPVIDRIAVTSP